MDGRIFTGSPLVHPNAEIIGTTKGLLSKQDMDFRNGIGALRMGLRRRYIGPSRVQEDDPGYAPIPDQVNLVMDGPWHVHGKPYENPSLNPCSGDVRLILAHSEEGCFYWTVVEIHDDTIKATLHRNPVDEMLAGPATSS